jgi:subtilisin family serine protease
VLVGLALALAGPGLSAAAAPPDPPAPGALVTRLLVKYRPGATAAGADGVTGAGGVTAVRLRPGRAVGGGVTTVALERPVDLDTARRAARQLAADPRVEYAEPDIVLTAASATAPNDPMLPSQWALIGESGTRAPVAWARTTGTGAVVAVLDTGITTHPDLAGQLVDGYDLIDDLTVAADGDGRDPDPTDPGDWTGTAASSWHGTHVTGIVAAASDNGVGIASVAPGARVQPVRVLGRGGGYLSDIEAGVRWAAGLPVPGVPANPTPAQVINMSLSGSAADGCPASLQQAIDAAVAAGTTVVVAAGNNGASASGYTPANCARVVTVAATGPEGYRASYSNNGRAIDLAAPGGDFRGYGTGGGVLSTRNTGTSGPGAPAYAYLQGTSMAAPHVAGAVALMLAVDPRLTPAQVEARLTGTARAEASCSVADCGAGLLDAGAALPVVAPGAPQQVTVSPQPGALDVTWTPPASDGGAPVTEYTARAHTQAAGGTVAASCSTAGLACALTGLRDGRTYHVDVVARSSAGAGPPSAPRVASTPRAGPAVRWWGADRYATAAAVSAGAFSPGVGTVFVATGAGFPDALAGAAAAGSLGGPVLLVPPAGVPGVVAAELSRLAPGRIVVLGGPGAVPDAVLAELVPYAGVPADG